MRLRVVCSVVGGIGGVLWHPVRDLMRLGYGGYVLEVCVVSAEVRDLEVWQVRCALVYCLGERERWWRGLGVGVAYGRRGEREALRGSWGEGEVDMGRRWHLGEQERRERGPGGARWRLGERERREWVVEAWWRCGEHERRGWVRRAGGEGERRCLRDRASQKASACPGAPGAAPLRTGGVGRGAVAAVGGGTGRVGPGGPPLRGRGGRGDTVAGTGGVCGWSARWLPSHTLVLFMHGGLWPGGVGWWAVVVVGVVLVVVVVGLLVVVALVVVGFVLRVRP